MDRLNKAKDIPSSVVVLPIGRNLRTLSTRKSNWWQWHHDGLLSSPHNICSYMVTRLPPYHKERFSGLARANIYILNYPLSTNKYPFIQCKSFLIKQIKSFICFLFNPIFLNSIIPVIADIKIAVPIE